MPFDLFMAIQLSSFWFLIGTWCGKIYCIKWPALCLIKCNFNQPLNKLNLLRINKIAFQNLMKLYIKKKIELQKSCYLYSPPGL